MANVELAHPDNAPGEFFDDTQCINCPTCRQLGPTTFGDAPAQPVVVRQPVSDAEKLQALIALGCEFSRAKTIRHRTVAAGLGGQNHCRPRPHRRLNGAGLPRQIFVHRRSSFLAPREPRVIHIAAILLAVYIIDT